METEFYFRGNKPGKKCRYVARRLINETALWDSLETLRMRYGHWTNSFHDPRKSSIVLSSSLMPYYIIRADQMLVLTLFWELLWWIIPWKSLIVPNTRYKYVNTVRDTFKVVIEVNSSSPFLSAYTCTCKLVESGKFHVCLCVMGFDLETKPGIIAPSNTLWRIDLLLVNASNTHAANNIGAVFSVVRAATVAMQRAIHAANNAEGVFSMGS
jgi:hypothetical protein